MIYNIMEINNKYQNGKIYKITDIGYNKCYIGSTIENIKQRIARHRHNYKEHLKGKFNNVSSFKLFEEFGVENCKIELVESYPCNNKDELEAREGYYIRNTECVNKLNPDRTKEDIVKYQKEYRINNIDRLTSYNKQYREGHRDEISEKRSVLNECCCGVKFQLSNQARHFKSKHHQAYLEKQKEEKKEMPLANGKTPTEMLNIIEEITGRTIQEIFDFERNLK